MKFDILIQSHPVVDILIAVAERGGVENCINMLGKYLTEKGYRIRIIQMVFEGTEWADDCMEFHYIYTSRAGHNLQDFTDGYEAFLKKFGNPSLTIATAWPMMSYIAKKASSNLGCDLMVGSWLHAPLGRYEAAGFGGADYADNGDLHFAISDEIAEELRAYNPEAVIYRVNNPVDMSKIHKVEAGSTRTLLFVGRLSAEKNIGLILRALSGSNSEWKLKLVGDGDKREELEKTAEELGIESRVEFIGWSDNPWKYADESCALIMASVYEGAPMVAIEALSCGLPVIANVSSRVVDIIEPGKNGYLYPDESVDDLSKILNYIAEDRLPHISSEYCRNSVVNYSASEALWDFCCKIHTTISGRIITDKLWKHADRVTISDKVSVIIPCYNTESYISRCLDSVLSQSIGLSHLEILAVNDGSTDGTLEILKEYEVLYPDNICIIDCEENYGQSHARNTALEYASGDYILFVDSDDVIAPKMIETMVLADKCYPSDIVSCDFISFYGDEIPEAEDALHSKYCVIETENELKQLFMDNAFITAPWGKLYKSDFIYSHNDLRFPEGYRMEDIFFSYMSVAYAATWQHISAKFYCYYQNPDGIMKSNRLKDYYMDVHNVFAMAMDRYKELGLFDCLKQEIEFVYIKKVYEELIAYMKTGNIYSVNNNLILSEYLAKNFKDIADNRYLKEDDFAFIESSSTCSNC